MAVAVAKTQGMVRELSDGPGASDRRWHGTDHDLLVRIDERLLGMKDSLENAVGEIVTVKADVASLKSWRATVEGSQAGIDRVNARVASVLVVTTSVITAIALRAIEWLSR